MRRRLRRHPARRLTRGSRREQAALSAVRTSRRSSPPAPSRRGTRSPAPSSPPTSPGSRRCPSAWRGRAGSAPRCVSTSMDRCFTGLIDAVTPFGGDVLFFGGDALFVAFLGDDHARQAVDGGGRDAARLARDGTAGHTARFGSHARCRSVSRRVPLELVVGDGPQRPMFLAGPTVSRTVLPGGPCPCRRDPSRLDGTAASLADAPTGRQRRRRVDGDHEPTPTAAAALEPPVEPITSLAAPRPELHLPAALRPAPAHQRRCPRSTAM